MPIEGELFLFLFEHVFLPPRLPQQLEESRSRLEDELTLAIRDLLRAFVGTVSQPDREKWNIVLQMLDDWAAFVANHTSAIDAVRLKKALSRLTSTGGAIAFHITTQNCGWIAFRDEAQNSVLIDAFEVSPTNSAVVTTPGPLLRRFPGMSISIGLDRFNNDAFLTTLVDDLHELSAREVVEMVPTTRKSGEEVEEHRETTHPGLVTEGLMMQLLSFGEWNDAPPIFKSTRDEVNWHNALLPWRRSARWLSIRASLQIVLVRLFGDVEGRLAFKNFMLYLIARLGHFAISDASATNEADFLQIILAKIDRRSFKLQGNIMGFVKRQCQDTIHELSGRLSTIQTQLIKFDKHTVPPISPSAPNESFITTLQSSHEYLENAMHELTPRRQPTDFNRPLVASWQLDNVGLPRLKHRLSITDLGEFEIWVERDLQDWFEQVPSSELLPTCLNLGTMINTYYGAAQVPYENDPRARSLMVLVIMELWMAMDKIATRISGLLVHFHPGIPTEFLQPLLLPKKQQVRRAACIEEYLRDRNSVGPANSIFNDPGKNTFAVEFFDDSPAYQMRMRGMQEDSRRRKNAKREKYDRQMKRYESLQQKVDNSSCSYSRNETGQTVHDQNCKHCGWSQMLKGLTIQVFEELLPEDEAVAKNFVFELAPPEWFAQWRDVTWSIVHDLCERKAKTGRKPDAILRNHAPTKMFYEKSDHSITLGSPTKSWLVTHLGQRSIPTSFEAICLPCGLKPSLFDEKRKIWINDQVDTPSSMKDTCTFQIGPGPYSELQFALSACKHGENDILAIQHKCHPRLAPREFIAYGSLRAGENLQWINILREIAAIDLSLNQEPVLSLLKQAAWEFGPRDTSTHQRIAHEVMEAENPSFINALLGALEEKLCSIEGNWNQACALESLVIIGLRSLSFSPVGETTTRALGFMRRCRETSLNWCERLVHELHESGEDDTQKQQSLLLRVAVICQMTYDVDLDHIIAVLHGHNDLYAMVRSSVILFDNSLQVSAMSREPGEVPLDSDSPHVSTETRMLLDVAQRVRCLVKSRMYEIVKMDPSGLSRAIEKSLNSLQLHGVWSLCDRGIGTGWLRTRTNATLQARSQEIHYNLLTGEILVDNCTSGRLPIDWRDDKIYKELFGAKSIPVLPSNLPGSKFVSAKIINGFEIHFAMEQHRLVLKARTNSQIWRLIPRDVISNDFSSHLVRDFVQWLNLETGEMEFRSAASPWETSDSNWRLKPDSGDGTGRKMLQGEKVMIDRRSPFFENIAQILRPLERDKHLTIFKSAQGVIEIHLNRLRLSFVAKEDGKIECRELEASVDTDQDIGCFYGLYNKLVFTEIKPPKRRFVIVPFGDVQFSKEKSRVIVNILSKNSDHSVKYLQYYRDDVLAILRSPPQPLAILYQALLHALTAFPIPDPLTGRSGTEEALRILRQPLCSPITLSVESKAILRQIGNLTPKRTFYPIHHKVMQDSRWVKNLGQLAQHDGFYDVARDIIQFSFQCHTSEQSQILNIEDEFPYKGDQSLRERARSRNSQFHSGGAADHGVPISKHPYNARDSDYVESERSHRVWEISILIETWPTQLNHAKNLIALMKDCERVHSKSLPETADIGFLINLPINEYWISIFRACQSTTREQGSFSLRSLFWKIAFGGHTDQSVLRQLLLVALSRKCNELQSPPDGVFQFQRGWELNGQQIEDAIVSSLVPIPPIPTGRRNRRRGTRTPAQLEGLNQRRRYQVQLCRNSVETQWPHRDLQALLALDVPEINIEEAVRGLNELFSIWDRNGALLDFFQEVEKRLCPFQKTDLHVPQIPMPKRDLPCTPLVFHQPSLMDLVKSTVPPPRHTVSVENVTANREIPVEKSEDLEELARGFEGSEDKTHREYGVLLSGSIQALTRVTKDGHSEKDQRPLGDLREDLSRSRTELLQQYMNLWWGIYLALKSTAEDDAVRDQSNVWPEITMWSILSLLASSEWTEIPEAWRISLVDLGKTMSSLRRCDRLIAHWDAGNKDAFLKDIQHQGCDGWDPLKYPVWLVLEIENDITIRKHQAEVAFQIISPAEEKNAVLQLNMGEGKTSVIIPMAAAVLANGYNLCRVIVLGPLLRQSVNLLSCRLGAMVNRHIYHIPFTRSTAVDIEQIRRYEHIFSQCLSNCGVIVALPEHILSLRLAGLESVEEKPYLSGPLLRLDQALQGVCRDVIDESDEVLDPKFQLVYTMGVQQGLDGGSDRWEIVQSVLDLVAAEAKVLQQEDPQSIELDCQRHRYPIMTFLRASTFERLSSKLLDRISISALSEASLAHWTGNLRASIMRFIGKEELSEKDAMSINAVFAGKTFLTKLLVLRGLFAYKILKFTIAERRWLVEYGLHLSRSLMAVPYRAKGVPSENAEFGHPEVAIVLTCLSYYYEGLNIGQLKSCFERLSYENDADATFCGWIEECADDLPPQSRVLSGVNIEDQGFETQLFPILRYQKGILDFYLSQVVFAKGAKEFPQKLSMSAWDLPARNGLCYPPTTGFSGTNDNRFLLPFSIKQNDLPHLHHTNAMVISHLLRAENRQCVVAEGPDGRSLSVEQLLVLATTQCKAKVFIDVGALILESQNHAVAELWLSITPEEEGVHAAIFFNEEGEVMVVDRSGNLESLISSSFKQRIASCLVFLDQHHSRGVDLKLPPGTRAAVTLGPRLTKDRLVQACNRLRELGKCHSVSFLIPPEVKHNMTAVLNSSKNTFDSFDVIRWSMIQTCVGLDILRPLWAWQGLEYFRRIKHWDAIDPQCLPSSKALARIQERESRTLQELYFSGQIKDNFNEYDASDPSVAELLTILKSESNAHPTGPNLAEEQEREVAFEIERQKQRHCPPAYKAHKGTLNPEVEHFARHGTFRSAPSFKRAFGLMRSTSARHRDIPNSLGEKLLVTRDYEQSVKIRSGGNLDEFLKPVHWVMTSIHNDQAIILSQFEASAILARIKKLENTTIHVYTPRLSSGMRSFHHLDFFNIGAPSRGLTAEQARDLELFSGSLYFSSYEEYKAFRLFLGLLPTQGLGNMKIPEGVITSYDGFVPRDARAAMGWPLDSPFLASPLPFLDQLISMRMKSQGWRQTHLGSIIKGIALPPERFSQ